MSNNIKISICIPVWEYYGEGVFFLKKNLESIKNQTYKNFNVVISDHSSDDKIESLCNSFKDMFEIIYVKNINKIGNSPSNTNNAIKNAYGDIIKILFQDDFFYDENSLEIISKEFENHNCDWLVTGCNHTNDGGKTFYNRMTPAWNNDIFRGVNTISSPSVLAFLRTSMCFFDENLTMLMDCEMYWQLYKKYGLPKIVSNCLVTNRIHKNQISQIYTKDISEEINYIISKHNII